MPGRTLRLVGLIGLLCAAPTVAELPPENPRRVEAAFLRNFVHYVTWPAAVTAAPAWRLCVLGDDPFGDLLDRMVEGRTEQGRPFAVSRARTADAAAACHIVFVALDDAGRRRQALTVLRARPVLTVGEAPDFLREGGIIQFEFRDRLLFDVNLDGARIAGLQVQTPMLEVSHQVVEGGRIRRVR